MMGEQIQGGHYLTSFARDGKEFIEGTGDEIRDGSGTSREGGDFVGKLAGFVVRGACQMAWGVYSNRTCQREMKTQMDVCIGIPWVVCLVIQY
jgi:hypothetical protein